MTYYYRGKTQAQTDAEVINFITLLHKIYGETPEYNGSCYKFHKLLYSVFGGLLFYDGNHIITRIGRNFFDSKGKVIETEEYLPEEDYGSEYFKNAFKEYF
jgi:hypothetical protein